MKIKKVPWDMGRGAFGGARVLRASTTSCYKDINAICELLAVKHGNLQLD